MKRGTQSGMTLVELLVGMALMGIVLTALVNYFNQGSRIATQSSSRSELQQEILNVQQLITGRLKEAWYIFPEGKTFDFGTGQLRKNPLTNTGSWTVGTQPLLALILPPRVLPTSTNCVAPSTSGSGDEPTDGSLSTASGGQNDGCYRFFAYYPVKRSQWVGNTSGAGNPGADTLNGNTWVLAEYRDYFYGTSIPDKTDKPTISPNRSRVYLLADYIDPANITPTYTMFTFIAADGKTTSATNTVTGVTLNLATTRNVGGKVLRLPGAAGTYSITIYPTNLGKVAAN